jgi:hypothetical protein
MWCQARDPCFGHQLSALAQLLQTRRQLEVYTLAKADKT